MISERYRLGTPIPGSPRARQIAAKEHDYFRLNYMTPQRPDDPNAGKPCWHCGEPATETIGPKGPQSCDNFQCRPTFAQRFARKAKLFGGGTLGVDVLIANHNGHSFAEMLAAADSVGQGGALRKWHEEHVAEGGCHIW